MGANSFPETDTRQRRDCDLNPGPSAPESSTLTTRLPSHPMPCYTHRIATIDSVTSLHRVYSPAGFLSAIVRVHSVSYRTITRFVGDFIYKTLRRAGQRTIR